MFEYLSGLKPENVITLIIGCISLLFPIYISIKGTNKLASFLYSFIGIITGPLWSVAIVIFRETKSLYTALICDKIIYLVSFAVAPLFIIFSRIFPKKKRIGLVFMIFLSFSTLFFIYEILFTKNFIREVIFNNWGNNIVYGWAYVVWFFWFVILMSWGQLSMLLEYKKLEGAEKEQTKYIVFGAVFPAIGTLPTNALLPLLGFYQYIWVGPLFMIIMHLIVAYGITRTRFTSTKRILYYILFFTFSSLLIFLIVAVTELTYGIKNRNIYLIPIIIFWGIMIPFLINLAQSFSKKILSTNYQSIEKVKADFLAKISSEMNTQRICNLLLSNIRKFFDIEDVYVVIFEINKDKLIIFQEYSQNFSDITESVVREILDYIKEMPDKNRFVVLSEFKYLLSHDLAIPRNKSAKAVFDLMTLMDRYKIEFIAPFATNDNKNVLLLTGPKRNNEIFLIEEIQFIESLIQNFSISISRAMLYQEVQSFNEQLKTKVEEATMQLKDKIKKLQDLRQRERDMIDIMGHELRTPLTIIKNAVGIIDFIKKNNSKKVKWDPLIEEQYKNISDALKREIILVETMLSATKIDADKLELNITDVDMRQMLQQLILAFGPQAEEKGLKFDIVYDNKKEWIVKADPIRLQEVMDNLVSNAVKYTNRGFILIELIDLKKSIKVNVIDTGEGISKQDLRNLGKKFYRANQYIGDKNGKIGKMVRPGGSGLGLYVTFGLIKAMNGTIEVQSELGKGSTFSFTIPKNKSV